MNDNHKPFVNLRVAIFVKLIFVSLLLMASPSVVIAGQGDDRVNTGLNLVETFYEDMLNEQPIEECRPIFIIPSHPTYNRATHQQVIWKFIRKNRDLFLSPIYTKDPADFFPESGKAFTYRNPRKDESVTSGFLDIVLSSSTAKLGENGVDKEIAFPIAFDEHTDSWKIHFYLMRINGVLIYPEGEFERNFDLWKVLGLK